MLKRSLVAVAILGTFAVTAGAYDEGQVKKAKDLQAPELELVLEAAPATCAAIPADVQDEVWFANLLQQQPLSPRLETSKVASYYFGTWGYRGGPRYCWVCTFVCYRVRC